MCGDGCPETIRKSGTVRRIFIHSSVGVDPWCGLTIEQPRDKVGEPTFKIPGPLSATSNQLDGKWQVGGRVIVFLIG